MDWAGAKGHMCGLPRHARARKCILGTSSVETPPQLIAVMDGCATIRVPPTGEPPTMPRVNAAPSLLPILFALPSCSLLIDTNPDGVVFLGGAAGWVGSESNAVVNSGGVGGAGAKSPSAPSATAGSAARLAVGGSLNQSTTYRGGNAGAGNGVVGPNGSELMGGSLGAPEGDASGGTLGAIGSNSGVPTIGGGMATGVGGTGSSSTARNESASGGAQATGSTSTSGGTSANGGAPATGGTSAVCSASQTRSCSLAGALGTCASGTQTCVNGSWGACSILPALADTCESGNDDNCNGKPNDTACRVVQISAGYAHTCALLSDGMVRCWGANSNGELGNAKTTFNAKPVLVSNLRNVQHINVGQIASCAVVESGAVYCWGGNWYGHLGSGTAAERSATPVQVVVSDDVRASAVAVGDSHACLLVSADGSVLCWGDSSDGHLGDGGTGSEIVRTPVAVSGLSGITSIRAGQGITCAVHSDATVRCWGTGKYGVNGWGTTGESAPTPHTIGLPRASFPLTGVIGIGIGPGGLHACALLDSGTARCWGFALDGQLGNTTVGNSEYTWNAFPVSTAEGLDYTGFTSLAAGGNHTCGILSDETMVCWGKNTSGQLGNGNTIDQRTPAAVVLSAKLSAVTAGGAHTCAVTTDGAVLCWGSNASGQLGDNTTTQRNKAVQVLGLLP